MIAPMQWHVGGFVHPNRPFPFIHNQVNIVHANASLGQLHPILAWAQLHQAQTGVSYLAHVSVHV